MKTIAKFSFLSTSRLSSFGMGYSWPLGRFASRRTEAFFSYKSTLNRSRSYFSCEWKTKLYNSDFLWNLN